MHFYHLWADGDYGPCLADHVPALTETGFAGPVYLGIIGHAQRRIAAFRAFEDLLGRRALVAVSQRHGYEHPTIDAVRRYALHHSGAAVMYAHTKGAAHDPEWNAVWRRSMTVRLVKQWPYALEMLDCGVQAVGCHWLHPESHPVRGDDRFFGGNYWIAACDYLATLPTVDRSDAFTAERWIGLGRPRVMDLRPGWPSPVTCGLPG